jgi:D-aspartate ligase
MTSFFLEGDALLSAIHERVNDSDQPAAIIFNSHITGLAVSRSLGRRGVPVVALDRDQKGYALASRYATVTGRCPNVLEDETQFIDALTSVGKALKQPGVLYPTNDEWVLAVNRHRGELERHFLIPFAGPEIVEPVLDKARLYRTAMELGIPIPRTWFLDDMAPEELASQLTYPCIVKPTEQRSFYEAFGDKAWRVETPEDLAPTLERAAGHNLVAQEIVGQGLTDFYSVCSYIGADGEAHGVFVGRKLEQYPPDFGTGCLVKSEWVPEIAERGVQILKTFGYRGVSEVEFIYDARDGEHKLLDVNTRVWKWIGLPIAAGVDLPWLAYADITGAPERAPQPRDGIAWTYAKDYFALRLAGYGKETAAFLTEDAWAQILTGRHDRVIDAVIDPDDPQPAARMIQNLFLPESYFCAC